MTTLRAGWIITLRGLAHWARQPAVPIFGLLFSVMLLLVFGLLLGGAMEVPGDGDYLDYLLPGMLTLAMMFGVEATATAMTNDVKRGVTDRFRSMPISAAAVSLGRAGADMVNAMAELGTLVVVGVLIGWRIDAGIGSAALAIALLLALRLAMIWVGIFLGIAFRGGGTTSAVQVLVWPIGFLSAAVVPVETMPDWLGAISAWNPVSATATAARELLGNPSGLSGGLLDDHAILLAISWPVVLTAIFLPLSARAYRRLRH